MSHQEPFKVGQKVIARGRFADGMKWSVRGTVVTMKLFKGIRYYLIRPYRQDMNPIYRKEDDVYPYEE